MMKRNRRINTFYMKACIMWARPLYIATCLCVVTGENTSSLYSLHTPNVSPLFTNDEQGSRKSFKTHGIWDIRWSYCSSVRNSLVHHVWNLLSRV